MSNVEPETDVSFVIPSYQSRETIAATLDSILSQKTSLSVQILVVDSLADRTDTWIDQNYPNVRRIAWASRLFPGAARNLGARESTGKHLAFLDADAAAEPNWLETLHSKLVEMPEIRMIGGAIANGNRDSLASRVLHWIEFSEFLPWLPSGFRAGLSSSNLFIRREDFFSCGGFPEELAMAEDLAFSEKLAGKLYFTSCTCVLHHHRSDWSSVSNHLWELGYWSGRYRRAHAVAGSWLRHAPFLTFGLPLLRAARISSRIFRSSWKEGVLALLCLPFLLVGLSTWSAGFYQGVRAQQT